MESSPLALAVERIGDRWTLLIVDALMAGPLKFGELEAHVTGTTSGIAPTVLTKRLRQLEADGIVVGRPYTERPVRLIYELTGPGAALAGAVHLLRDWGAAVAGDDTPATHPACGSPLTTRLWCASCEQVVDPGEADQNIVL
ncbi:MAG: helix-turn-helix domain-containing protein [Acidimicrobiales bacterium]